MLTPTRVEGAPVYDLATGRDVAIEGDALATVTSVSVSDRECRPGALFAALPGQNGHGARFSTAARDAGAVAVLTDLRGASLARESGLPLLVTPDPRRALGAIAARVYGTDRVRPRLFGVTGTNGKTTTVHVLDAILGALGVRSGCSSTVHRRSGATSVSSRLTSPEAPELHALLARMNEDATEAAAVEVSAQALTNQRIGGVTFDVAGFTNLSHDHLDEYGSMNDYLAAKIALFQPDRARNGVVSLDSPAGATVVESARIPVTTITSRPGVHADWRVHDVAVRETSTRLQVTGPGGQHLEAEIPLLGGHMAADFGLALVMLVVGGYDFGELRRRVERGIHVDVSGHTALVSGATGPRVYVDISHTPDSTEKNLTALRGLARGPLVVVMGADGDKDATKRGPMGAVAAAGADVVVITDHHSRYEDPASIRRALVAGAESIGGTSTVLDIGDSRVAIRRAIALAGESGTVLWTGPGSYDYRVIEGVDVPYSPRMDAAAALTEAGWPAADPLVGARVAAGASGRG